MMFPPGVLVRRHAAGSGGVRPGRGSLGRPFRFLPAETTLDGRVGVKSETRRQRPTVPPPLTGEGWDGGENPTPNNRHSDESRNPEILARYVGVLVAAAAGTAAATAATHRRQGAKVAKTAVSLGNGGENRYGPARRLFAPGAVGPGGVHGLELLKLVAGRWGQWYS